MRVYVVRHTDAEPAGGRLSDADRSLSAKGKKQAEIIGVALRKLGAEARRVLSSPLLRARQTGEILARSAGWSAAVEESDSLLPGVPPAETIRALASLDFQEIAAVGHAPQVEELVSLMLAGKSRPAVEMKKGSVACVEFDGGPAAGKGTLLWHITVKAVQALLQ